jgi:hypothetical protein
MYIISREYVTISLCIIVCFHGRPVSCVQFSPEWLEIVSVSLEMWLSMLMLIFQLYFFMLSYLYYIVIVLLE